ncbi:hypothetical protein IFM89_022135 [Coptis chinensis]|uniref:3-dehydroquinate synthase N-terminal domain-containing protein n=1 Tax=Coptis chinensis TaxID=261450 RepID=A0A835I2C2_9MAGN|nr:hypothetical protein IFM89_022135 [Coptis chinensis]
MATARPVVLPASQVSRFSTLELNKVECGRISSSLGSVYSISFIRLQALQDTQKAVFSISKTLSEAQALIEVFEQGLRGVVLQVEDVDFVLELKVISLGVEVFNYSKALALIVAGIIRTILTEDVNPLNLVKATVTRVQVEWVITCVDLCTLLRPSEGILV